MRSAAASRSTSSGAKIRGSVRGTRTSGTRRGFRDPPCELLRRGISCRVTGRAQTYPTSTQGHALQPRTLELSHLMGIAPQIFATGTTSLVTNFYADGKLILQPDMGIGRDGPAKAEPDVMAPSCPEPGQHQTCA